MVCKLIRKICGTQKTTVKGEGSCKQTGHDYSIDFSENIYSTTVGVGRGDVEIYKRVYKKCSKCDSLNETKKTIAKVKVTDDNELKKVN